ncbi:hypothetical protein H0E87_000234 [Populus deltoides]|uniref:Protein kinase domain-containing protein n=1 Tax=Populus deltoides TaxID=3696 RepID=A0A8T2ZLT3_POPDE|nr:hypothetical protein H0E87_000234 [Populus deltoides]
MEKVQGRGFLGVVFLVIVFLSVSSGEAQSRSFLVNCGANSSVNVDGRRWIGDLVPNDNFTVSSPGVAATDSTANGDSLYRTARIFDNGLNYTFSGVQGNYFVRLHFCPFPIENHNVNESLFSVVANGLKLLADFNVPGEISDKYLPLQNSNSNSSSLSLVKEYILAINDVLVVEFIPSKGSFGFINAMEIVPVIGTLFADLVRRVGGSDANVSGRGIETMYRLNVGGQEIKPDQDSDLWRKWEVDSSYMITADAGVEIKNSSNVTYASNNDSSVAPLLVYETARIMSNTEVLEKKFNMSWKFVVDPDFDYLIRLHFCELVYDKANQRIFKVYINNKTAADNFDVYARSGGKNIAYHQDYFDAISAKINTLWIQLGPDTAVGASGTDALLNGLEIFKLSRSGNLAYGDRIGPTGKSASHLKSWILWLGIGAGVASALIIAIACACIFCFCKSQRNEMSNTKDNPPGWRPLFMHGAVLSNIANAKGGAQTLNGSVAAFTRVGKRFTLSEIRAATDNFDDSLVIGVGGFGKVYKGEIEDGTLAAIKRSNPQSEQGLAEFETEIEMLSKLRHRHLVSLIGLPKDQINLAEWAMKWQRQRSLETIIDPRLRGNSCPESLKKFGEIAEKCLADEGKNRPTMGEVLWHLEYVLQLHEAWMRTNATETSITSSQALEDLELRVAEDAQRRPSSLDEDTVRPQHEG